MLRDRLKARMDEMGARIDYVRLVDDVLGIRNAPFPLARRLVEEALVVGDRREEWTRAGQRICADAPTAPGVYVLRDGEGAVLYVGKANNLKRRFNAHFAPRRWLRLDAKMARVASAEWTLVGSEIEALLIEAEWIATLSPRVNVQIGPPSMKGRRVRRALVQDVVIVMRASDADHVTLVAARIDGPVRVQRTLRDGSELSRDVPRLWRFLMGRFTSSQMPSSMARLAPLVFSWLTARGASATRFDMKDFESSEELKARLVVAFSAPELFNQRLIVRGT